MSNEDVTGKKLEIKNWPSEIGFNPHGMDIHYASKSLYVVNHAMKMGGERVEVFNVNTDQNDIPTSLTYSHSIISQEMNEKYNGILNSISIIEPNVFYITNFNDKPKPPFGPEENELIPLFRQILWRTTKVNLIEYDPNAKTAKMTTAASNLSGANGITQNKDGDIVYVADSYAKSVHKFKRDKKTNMLTRLNEVKVGYLIDNLKYDSETDSVLTGGIVSISTLKKIMTHMPKLHVEPGVNSVIMDINVPSSGDGTFRKLAISDKVMFLSNGLRMSKYILGGSPTHPGIIICPLKEDTEKLTAKALKVSGSGE